MYIVPRTGMGDRRSTTLPLVSIFVSPSAWPHTNTTAFIHAGIVTYHTMQHILTSSVEASSWEFSLTLNTLSSVFIDFISVFVEIIASGFDIRGTVLRYVRNIPRLHR